jgi:hypothetical protein
MLYDKPWEHPRAVATLFVVILLSSNQLFHPLHSWFCHNLNRVTWSNIICDLNVLERISQPSCEPLYALNTSHYKQETFLYEYLLHWVLLHTKTHNRVLVFGSTLLKHSHHSDYWNQPLNMCMYICCLDCLEAGLYCYLVIHIENLLRPLQLFYFHLSPIYWLSLVLKWTLKKYGVMVWKDFVWLRVGSSRMFD